MADLLIDAGNTRIKWALSDRQGGFVERGALPTCEAKSLLDVLPVCRLAVDCAIYVSVVDEPVNQAIEEVLSTRVGQRWARFVSTEQAAGMRNDYAVPAQLGPDRLAAALGAWQRVAGDCLVVSCGTATTIDRVERLPGPCPVPVNDESGLQKKSGNATFAPLARFAGGVILPGLALMKSALCQNTARLPDAAGRFVAVPDNTDDAIETGCLLAQVGAIGAMWRGFSFPVPVVLAGGAGGQLLAHLASQKMPVIDAPELVLEGLAVAILRRFP